MRKYIRKMMRARGEKEHAKPSRVVKYLFNKYQIEKYGIGKRSSNMAHGTHCKKTWNQRQAIADGLIEEQMKLAKVRARYE